VANRVYAVNYANDTVTVINGTNSSVIAKVGVERASSNWDQPADSHDLRGEHAQQQRNDDRRTSNSVIATVAAGNGPYAIAVDTTADKAYVSNMGKDSLTVIDGPRPQACHTLAQPQALVKKPPSAAPRHGTSLLFPLSFPILIGEGIPLIQPRHRSIRSSSSPPKPSPTASSSSTTAPRPFLNAIFGA